MCEWFFPPIICFQFLPVKTNFFNNSGILISIFEVEPCPLLFPSESSSMASDSHTPTATTPEKPLEDKVNEEAKLMEKEIVSSDSADVVNEKPALDSNPAVTKEEEIDQTPAGEPEKELPAVVEEVQAVVKAEKSTEKEKDENSEKVAEQVGLKEPILVKEGIEEVNVEVVDAEKTEAKPTLESVVEEDNKDKEEKKIVDSESTDEAEGKDVEPVDIQPVRDVSAETAEDKIKDVEVPEVEPKAEDSEKVESQPEKARELAPEVVVIKAEETPETTEQTKVELKGKLEDRIVETKDSSINSKDEKTSESGSALCPEEIVPTIQESDTDPKKETEGEASSPVDFIEKAITEEKHVMDEPSKDEKTSESGSTLPPEEIVTTNEESDTDPKKETEGEASSPVDVIEKAITEEKHVVDEPSKDEKTSESGSALCPEEIVPTNQESDTDLKKDTEGDASSPADVIEKGITEEKHVVDEPSNDEKTSESGSALCPDKVELVPTNQDTNSTKETVGDASSPTDVIEKAITEEKHVVDEPSTDEKTSESVLALCPEEIVPKKQDSDTNPKKESEGDVSSPADVIEKAITEEKHVVEEPLKDEKENVSEAKDVATEIATEGENIKKDTEPAADGMSEETWKETETESGEKESAASKQEESITEKVAEVVETAPVVKESDEPKQQPEVTAKEVTVKQKNSIMSKVKQSLVKAKKAIIGKSPSSKTISTDEAKEEIKVK